MMVALLRPFQADTISCHLHSVALTAKKLFILLGKERISRVDKNSRRGRVTCFNISQRLQRSRFEF